MDSRVSKLLYEIIIEPTVHPFISPRPGDMDLSPTSSLFLRPLLCLRGGEGLCNLVPSLSFSRVSCPYIGFVSGMKTILKRKGL